MRRSITGREVIPIGVLSPFSSHCVIKSHCSFKSARCKDVVISNVLPIVADASTSVELIKVVIPVIKLNGANNFFENHISVAQMPEYIDVVDDDAPTLDVVGASANTVKVVEVIDDVIHHNDTKTPVPVTLIPALNISVCPVARLTVNILVTN